MSDTVTMRHPHFDWVTETVPADREQEYLDAGWLPADDEALFNEGGYLPDGLTEVRND